ncbi:PPA6 [Symbiodinium sp. KB8]|nr:PPA6 [Symbiodinium sp. KB8]
MASESPSGVFAKSADWHITDQIGGGGGAAMDAPMPTTVEDLQAEVMRLRQELEKERTVAAMATPVRPRFRAFSEDSEDVPAPGENPLLVAQSSTLPDGSTVLISEAELAGMRKLFDLFDTNGDGHIEVANLVDLHKRLGEPVSEEEAKVIMADITACEVTDTISFDDFVRFWNGFHSIYIDDVDDGSADLRDKRRKAYMARFKFLKAKVPSVSIARITVQPRGTPGTLDYRVFFMREDATGKQLPISPWHDVPLHNEDGTLNFICEIPKWTRAKFEVATGEDFNPIKQDTKNGVLRDYAWGDMAFNYGCFPQTWEDPAHKSADCGGCIGDNDPLDVIDIGQRQWSTGAIVRVKVLGIVAMIDSGETDWKVITINVEDPMAELLHDIDDVKTQCPGLVEAFVHWLKFYKSSTGIINAFGFDGAAQSKEYAEKIIEETHASWKALVERQGSQAVLG